MSYLIYLRKSRKDLENPFMTTEEILNRHECILLDLAKKMNLSIGDIYREIVSGDSISARPVMQKLLREVESGMWEGVLVVEVERLARGDTVDQGIVQRTFQYSETLIITPQKTYNPSSESDQTFFEFGLFMSRQEYKTIKRRLKSGVMSAVREGKWPYNSTPYGYRRYKLENQKGWSLEFDEQERPIAELIYHLFCNEKKGFGYISDYLEAHNIKSRTGGRFTDSFLRDFLRNPVNDGKVFYGRRKVVTKIVNGSSVRTRPRADEYIEVDGLHEPLIPHDLFLKAQERFHTSTPRKPSTYTVKNPFSGLLVCSECGRKLQRRPASSSNRGVPYDMLMCNTRGCPTIGSAVEVVEREVLRALEDIVRGYEADVPSVPSLVPQKEELLHNAILRRADLNKQQERIYTLLEQGIYSTDVFLDRSKALESQMQEVEHSIEIFKKELEEEKIKYDNWKSFVPTCKQLLEIYWTLTPDARNAALKEVIDDVAAFELTLYPKIPSKS
ncbi:MAG: recombinase family protein [Lachnospiraceae bacterium]|nr:recombinase family protein [Lachnospiraceae bacterium]